MLLAQDAVLVLIVFLISLRNLYSNIDISTVFISINVTLLLNISVRCLSYVYYLCVLSCLYC